MSCRDHILTEAHIGNHLIIWHLSGDEVSLHSPNNTAWRTYRCVELINEVLPVSDQGRIVERLTV